MRADSRTDMVESLTKLANLRFHRRLAPLAAWCCLAAFSSVGAALAEESAAVADRDAPETSPEKYPLATQGPKPRDVVPPTDSELTGSISRGVDYLLESQRSNGAWGGPQKTKALNIFAPVPGSHLAFRTGVTSLSIEALIAARELFEEPKRKQIDEAIDRGEAWLLANAGELRRAEPDSLENELGLALYNVWGHSFAIHAIVPLIERARGDAERERKLQDLLAYQVHRLEGCTFVNGGWGYYDEVARTKVPSGSPTSFTTATALIALKKTEPYGLKYPAPLAKKAVDSLLRQRYPDFSYAYGEYLRLMPRLDINRPAGSLGRSQACNLALRLYGDKDVTDEILETWLDRLYARNGWLSIGRKLPVPHESHFRIAGYFYYYGHYYAAMCIDELPEERRPHFQDQLARILMPLQERDGSWWDYPLYDYHQAWGTGMTVSALVRCRRVATSKGS